MGTYRDLNDYELMYMVEENEDAKDLLFDKYRPIVIKMANKYKLEAKKIGLELDDLIQEGYVGLMGAIKNYNPNDKTLFYTYAIISINSKLLNCIRANSCKKHYCLNQSISLSKPISSNQDLMVLDFIRDNDANNPDLLAEEKELSCLLKGCLYSLEFNLAAVMELTMNGFSNSDISVLLDLPSKSISNCLFRIRKRMHESLSLFDWKNKK